MHHMIAMYPNGKSLPVETELENLAQCLRNCAAMLWMADKTPITDKEKRASVVASNEGQAKLAWKAAEIIEDRMKFQTDEKIA